MGLHSHRNSLVVCTGGGNDNSPDVSTSDNGYAMVRAIMRAKRNNWMLDVVITLGIICFPITTMGLIAWMLAGDYKRRWRTKRGGYSDCITKKDKRVGTCRG